MPHNPRADAVARLGGRYDARVLEPSPPAVNEGPWFADDPVNSTNGSGGQPVVSPVPGGDLLWAEVAGQDPALREWCAERWLIAGRRLPSVPDGLGRTRVGLHRLAEHVISPARRASNGKIGLRYTRGGFGTPFFGANVQVRVHGAELVVVQADSERRGPITSLAAAAQQIGIELEVEDAMLDIAPEAAAYLGDWYGFAALVLETLRAEAGPAAEPSRVQLWPEHFDLAVELGSEAAGARAAYGLSPGDEHHPEPYAYVAPWVAPPTGELWQARSFAGAELPYAELVAAPDQVASALAFLRARLVALTSLNPDVSG
jgi:hypothetical protein